VIPAKTAKPIEMPFGLRTLMGPGNDVLDDGPDPPWEGAIFFGVSHCKVLGHSTVICAKAAEPIEMLFGLWARMAQGIVLDGGPQMLRDVAMATNFWHSTGYNFWLYDS